MSHLRTVLHANPQAVILLAYRDALLARGRRERDRGDMPMGWVLVAALTISIVLAVGAILMTQLTNKASSLDLTTP